MVGWHHQLDGHEFEQALGVGDRQGGLTCCRPRGRKEVDKSAGLNKAGENNYAQDSSAGKESACNAGEPSLILGSERSPGKGIGYPLQYPWASLVAQVVKNPPAMWET